MGLSNKCSQLQEDLKNLLFDGSNLEKEDGSLFEFISNLDNPRDVLTHSNNFKDEGNSCFKGSDFNGALQKYSLACVFLSCVDLQKEDARMSFLQLASSTVLNMAATLLKKNEFRQVGQLCSIILDVEPNNIKALFRRAIAAMGLGKNELALWDLKLAYEVEPFTREVVKKLREVEMLLHTPPHDHSQGKEKVLKKTKGVSVENLEGNNDVSRQGQKERPNYIDLDNPIGMEVESKNNDKSTNGKEINQEMRVSKSKEVEMSERVEDDKLKDKEAVNNQDLKKHKFYFHNRRKPESTLAISKRDYHLLAQGRTLQHYNPRSGIVMSIRIKGSPQEEPKQPRESSPHPNIHPSPMEKSGLIPKDDISTHIPLGPETQILPKEIPPSELGEVIREQTICETPMIQDCSSKAIPFEPSHNIFRLITTGNRSPPRKAKHRAPGKGLKKEKGVTYKKSSCVLSNHVFPCRSKVAVSAQNSREHHLQNSPNLLGHRSGMKRKSSSLQSPDLLQHPKKFIIINNDVFNSSPINVFSLPMQVDSFSGCTNSVRI